MTTPTNAVHQLELEDTQKQQKCIDLLRQLDLTDDAMRRIMDQFELELAWAVDRDEHVRAKSSLGMKPAYIPELINGKENGQYLALDVGGTNFRVLLVSIRDGKKIDSTVEFYDVPDDLLTQSGEKLFEFFAQCTCDFIRKHRNILNCTRTTTSNNTSNDDGGNQIPPPTTTQLGFCFSLPMDHTSARNATLLRWTKRFKCPNTEGHDVTGMLQAQLDGVRTNVHVLVNVNDTVGTLMAGSVTDPNVRVGLILGSGSNTAFLERTSRVPKLLGVDMSEQAGAGGGGDVDGEMVIMEIDNGAFGDNGSIDFARSIWDRRVDGESNHPGSYTFEKLIGGAFLGEIIRHTICTLIEENLLFAPDSTPHRDAALRAFRTADTVPTCVVSDIVRDSNASFDAVKHFLRSLVNPGDESLAVGNADDWRLLEYVCWLISNRTAKLVACIQAQVLRHMDMPRDFCTAIAVTGSLFEKHPTLQQDTQHQMAQLVPEHAFRFAVVKDGSGEGAAFCAAVADRLQTAAAASN